jgi:hypothetical protein
MVAVDFMPARLTVIMSEYRLQIKDLREKAQNWQRHTNAGPVAIPLEVTVDKHKLPPNQFT